MAIPNYRGWKITFPGLLISVFPWFIRGLFLRNSRTHLGLNVRRIGIVLVSAGGGVEGLTLIAPCIEAWKQLDQDDAHDGCEMVIFAGAFIDETHFDALRALCDDGPFHIERFTSNFLAWMKHADLSISRAGYNTCMNVLETQVPTILVPSIAMDDQEISRTEVDGVGPRTGDTSRPLIRGKDGKIHCRNARKFCA